MTPIALRTSLLCAIAALTAGLVAVAPVASKAVASSGPDVSPGGHTSVAVSDRSVNGGARASQANAPRARPSLGSTGVPPGVSLRTHRGDLTITRAGTHIDRLDIRGFVTIKAPNVKITRSIVRGGTATYNRGMITNYGYDNLVVADTDFLPSNDTVWQDGMKGWDFTLRRVHITGNVDSVKVQGSNVTIADSLLGNTHYWRRDPNQDNGPSHNDGIQVQQGSNVSIQGNYVRRSSNFAILGASDIGHTSGLRIQGNWLDGGHCTVKLQEQHGYSLSAQVHRNKFGPNRKVRDCALVAVRGTSLSQSENYYRPGGRRVHVTWTDS